MDIVGGKHSNHCQNLNSNFFKHLYFHFYEDYKGHWNGDINMLPNYNCYCSNSNIDGLRSYCFKKNDKWEPFRGNYINPVSDKTDISYCFNDDGVWKQFTGNLNCLPEFALNNSEYKKCYSDLDKNDTK